jgi:hypothetical protein
MIDSVGVKAADASEPIAILIYTLNLFQAPEKK